MARTTPHTDLSDLGFDLIDHYTSEGDRKTGPVTAMHFAMAKRHPGSVVPVVHHVITNEFHNNPGKYNVSYHVTQAGKPYADGDFDFLRNHQDNVLRGSSDPLKDVITHHHGVIGALGRDGAPRLRPPRRGEIANMMPETGGLGSPMQYFNAVGDWPFHDRPRPLDMDVHRLLTGGGKGRPQFEYLGRIDPEDEHTDVYRADHEDPEDPYMRYGFTIRHMPSAEPDEDTLVGKEMTKGVKIDPVLTPRARVFSYSATHYPTDMQDDDGEYPVGEFQDVTGERSPVATFTSVGPLLERHKNVLRGLGLMDLPSSSDPRPAWHFTASGPVSDEDWDSFVAGRNPMLGMMSDGTPVMDHFDPSLGHAHAVRSGVVSEPEVYEPRGNCVTCGRSTWNERGGGQSPDWEHTGNAHYANDYEMHGPDIPQCANCANEYDTHNEAIRAGQRPGGLWHHPGARINSCPDCYRDALNE